MEMDAPWNTVPTAIVGLILWRVGKLVGAVAFVL